MKRTVLALAALAAFCTTGRLQADPINPVVEYSSAGTLGDTRDFTLGYQFTTSAALDINALGYWNDGLGNNHQVGIWDSVGNLLTSTTVQSTDSVVGHFQWHSIPDFLLAPGTYTIGGEYLGGPFPTQATGLVTDPRFTWVTDEQLFGAGLNYPTVSTGGSYGQNGILAADFSIASNASAVPEPATLTLLGFGVAGLLGYGWRKRKQASVTAA